MIRLAEQHAKDFLDSVKEQVEAKARKMAIDAGTDERLRDHALSFATWVVVKGIRHNPTPDDYRRFIEWKSSDHIIQSIPDTYLGDDPNY